MAESESYFLDTNILMYAIGKKHPYKQPCIKVLEQIRSEVIHVVTNVEVFQEIIHRYWSLQEQEVAAVAFSSMKKLCERVFPVLEADVDKAFQILQAYPCLGVRDAIHAATMINNGLRKIISTDKHFDEIEGIVRLDPLSGQRRLTE
ncbi:MAG: type II toxin-antitoxin system VapC family toxin [Acidobacteriota bacterium]